jgi:hypothetical protein
VGFIEHTDFWNQSKHFGNNPYIDMCPNPAMCDIRKFYSQASKWQKSYSPNTTLFLRSITLRVWASPRTGAGPGGRYCTRRPSRGPVDFVLTSPLWGYVQVPRSGPWTPTPTEQGKGPGWKLPLSVTGKKFLTV